MTDRELLELAAKAAGHKRTRIAPNGMNQVHGWHEGYDNDWEYWDPLKDDGDALRLAVKLRTGIEFDDDGGGVEVLGDGGIESLPSNGDLAEATRRAIVRAAAEQGKAMP